MSHLQVFFPSPTLVTKTIEQLSPVESYPQEAPPTKKQTDYYRSELEELS